MQSLLRTLIVALLSLAVLAGAVPAYSDPCCDNPTQSCIVQAMMIRCNEEPECYAYCTIKTCENVEQLNRMNYNLGMISGAVNLYYCENGKMPDSVAELLQSGLIPSNLLNLLSGQPFSYYADDCMEGDLVITNAVSDYCGITHLGIGDQPHTFEIYSADLPPCGHFGGDLVLWGYMMRVHNAFLSYWADMDDEPLSIDDLREAGYWPFDGLGNTLLVINARDAL